MLRQLHRVVLSLATAFLILVPGLSVPAGAQKARSPAKKAAEIPQAPVAELIQRILAEEARLDTARNLSALAATPEEKHLAQKAIQLADHQLNLAFLSALHRATESPPPPTPEARELDARVKALEASIQEQQALVNKLKNTAGAARGRDKEKLQAQLEFELARLDLAGDELAAAREDLINAGGDLKSQIQRLQADYQAAEQRFNASAAAAASTPAPAGADTVLGHLKLWLAVNAVRNQLKAARDSALAAMDTVRQHLDELEKEVARESSALPAAPGPGPAKKAGAASPAPADQSATEMIESMRKQSRNQKIIAGSRLRMRDLGGLAATYEKWDALEAARQKDAARSLAFAGLWIALVVLAGFAVNRLLIHAFSRWTQERRRLHTLHTMSRFLVQVGCLGLILLVVLGPPSQLATVIAFAGAGLTVALKDFIVSFIGWFMLMGRNGVHVGDWVEINAVCGEVIEVTLFHTVLLETGNWNDSGHPTGRRVNFTNSYAIEGHYFNFSTSGQWLWDELEFLIPHGENPNTVADAVLQMVTAETQASAQVAEQEWSKLGASAGHAPPSVSAAPVLSVRPSAQGINGRIRYITRANERFETRSRLYHLIVELLHSRPAQQTAVARASQPAGHS